jgi:hypothetical protein
MEKKNIKYIMEGHDVKHEQGFSPVRGSIVTIEGKDYHVASVLHLSDLYEVKLIKL